MNKFKAFIYSFGFWTGQTIKTFGNYLFCLAIAGFMTMGGAVLVIENVEKEPVVESISPDTGGSEDDKGS
ncbi:MAG: hypothetical protein DRN30_03220 [Thermoplasmata archaeon]|nr:MAG: hypothetical protein DRN30_03220 [Thermoplasmata archaeon]